MEDSRERERLVEVVASHIKSNLFDWRFWFLVFVERSLNIRGILFFFYFFGLSVGC